MVPLLGGDAERFGMGPPVMLGQDLADVARPGLFQNGLKITAVTRGLRPGVDQDDACADPDVLRCEVL